MNTAQNLQRSLASAKLPQYPKSLSILMGIFAIGTLFNACQIAAIKSNTEQAISAYTRAPVLVQVGRDAKPITAIQSKNGYLNQANIQAFVAEVIVPLYRYDRNLPAELGGKVDPGVTVPGIEGKVSTLHWVAVQAFFEPEKWNAWIQVHEQGAPQGFQEGVRSGLVNIDVKPAKKFDADPSIVSVVVTGTKIVEKADGQPVSRGSWARKLILTSSSVQRNLIKPNLLEKKFTYAAQRGIRIREITNAPEYQ